MDQLIVALDVENGQRALDLVSTLRGVAGGFKIGSRLFTLEGPDLVRTVVGTGARVFLDLKFHDIPNTVAQAVDAAVETGAWMINVHGAGGMAMMEAAADAAHKAAERMRRPRALLIAVTVLTSMNEATLRESGVLRPMQDHVIALARMAKAAGLDGVVASPQETKPIRHTLGRDFVIVTPGIRGASAGNEKQDQARTMGPADAVRAGANYIVVGRPIIAAADPRTAALAIVDELIPTV